MRVYTALDPSVIAELKAEKSSLVFIIDVLRFTTSALLALDRGVREIIPVATVAVARKLNGDNSRILLAGERHGYRIRGFDFGNSCREFSSRRDLKNRVLAWTTTNGTKALALTEKKFPTIYLLALVNIGSAVTLIRRRRPAATVLICSGNKGKPAGEDTFCAGLLIDKLGANPTGSGIILDAASRQAWSVYRSHADDPLNLLTTSRHGKYLMAAGFAGDLRCAARINTIHIAARYRIGRIKTSVFP